MSQSSFPRAEHIAALRQKIEQRILERRLSLEVAERGLNHYKCQYEFGFRSCPEEEWVQLGIHFEFARRLETAGGDAALNRFLDSFLKEHYNPE